MLKLLILMLSLFAASKSWAILGGVKVDNISTQKKVIMFDTRMNDISIVCSGSFISKNKLITAAHCFDHLKQLDCLGPNQCGEQKIIINSKEHKFKVSLHPNYQSKKRSIASYQTSSNFDIAVLELSNVNVKDYFKISESNLNSNKPLKFYGYGMTELRKLGSDQQTYYQEQGRGQLLQGIVERPKYKNGLIVNALSSVILDNDNKAVGTSSGHVLRSDSGGPLLMDDEIVGIVRNYQISDIVSEAAKEPRFDVIGKALTIQSTFTTLSHSSTQKFLKSHK